MGVGVSYHNAFRFVAQGALVVAYRHLPRAVPLPQGRKRGKVTEFSDRSRRRLAILLHRLSPAWGVFITLTVADASLAPRQVKASALRRVIDWLMGLGFEAVVWKQEFQRRGAVHYHLLALCWKRRPPWVKKGELAAKWGLGFVDVSFIDKGRLVTYVTKYVRKPVVEPVDLTHTDISDDGDVGPSPGRFWGVRGRESLVWASVALLERLPEALEGKFRTLLERVLGTLGFVPGVLYVFSRQYLTS